MHTIWIFFLNLLRIAIFAIVGCLLILCTIFALLQTETGKKRVELLLNQAFANSSVHVTFEGINGKLPFLWTIQSITIDLPREEKLTFSHLELRCAFFPLFKKQLTIDSLQIGAIDYLLSPEPPHIPSSAEEWRALLVQVLSSLTPPVHVACYHLRIDKLCFNSPINGSLCCHVNGSGKIRSDWKSFFCDLTLRDLHLPSDYAHVSVRGSKPKQSIETGVTIHSSPHALLEFFHLPYRAELSLVTELSGSWNTWKTLVWKGAPTGSPPLNGAIQGAVQLDIASYPLLNRKWAFSAGYGLQAHAPIQLDKLVVTSNLLSLKGQGEVSSELAENRLLIELDLPDLSLFYPELGGDLRIQTYFDDARLSSRFLSEQLEIHHLPWQHIRGSIETSLSPQIEGDLFINTTEGIFPWQISSHFSWDQRVSFSDITVTAGNNASLVGEVTIDPSSNLAEGNLYSQIGELSEFAHLFDDDNLKGRLAVECRLVQDTHQQNMDLRIAAEQLRYFDGLIDDLSCICHLSDIYNTPHGECKLLGEKIYTPLFYLDSLLMNASSTQHWNLDLLAQGSLHQEPFVLSFNGESDFSSKNCQIECRGLEGEVLGSPFSLDAPTTFIWDSTTFALPPLLTPQMKENGKIRWHFSLSSAFSKFPATCSLSPCAIHIGLGELTTDFAFDETHATAQLKMTHFPLSLLAIHSSPFSLRGTLSALGSFNATADTSSGFLNATLEETVVPTYGEGQSLQAKGSLQTHLENNALQLHLDLHGNHAQFLDFTATLPFHHTIYPLECFFSGNQPFAAELTAQGHFEEIFDFVNSGVHRLTGLLGTHLLFSQTLSSPMIQGEIEWTQGSYHNYALGTALENLNAHIDAAQGTLHLTELTATDMQGGELTVEGTLSLLEPNFPYSLSAELSRFKALAFGFIDANFTGPLYLTGNINSASLQGNLLVPKATVTLVTELPYKVPEISFTWINRPAYLNPNPSQIPSPFSLDLDITLTPENTIHVEGQGLHSEWKGALHLLGTPKDLNTNGKLQLVSGEYLFSGRIFRLTEGEILFQDKSNTIGYLNLKGIVNLSNLEITVQLAGPLTSPVLTFHSNPHLPTSAILSQILFNKDISEINQNEAIQLATTLMSLSSGGGPGILENIRKSLKVDRLLLVSDSGNSEQMAIQIGKYLTKGVMITLSQSAMSTKVIIEVELPKGFIFQAETQEEQEGKFSLKWRHSY